MKIQCSTCGDVLETRSRATESCNCASLDTRVSVDGTGRIYAGRLGSWTDVFDDEDGFL